MNGSQKDDLAQSSQQDSATNLNEIEYIYNESFFEKLKRKLFLSKSDSSESNFS